MDTRTLLSGLAGFFIGGLLVSVAATTFEKTSDQQTNRQGDMSMSQMVNSLKDKSGDEYDKAFISSMIEHHQSAVDMAKLSADRAKRNEVKQLSEAIVTAQEKEISEMKQWQMDWGYSTEAMDH